MTRNHLIGSEDSFGDSSLKDEAIAAVNGRTDHADRSYHFLVGVQGAKDTESAEWGRPAARLIAPGVQRLSPG